MVRYRCGGSQGRTAARPKLRNSATDRSGRRSIRSGRSNGESSNPTEQSAAENNGSRTTRENCGHGDRLDAWGDRPGDPGPPAIASTSAIRDPIPQASAARCSVGLSNIRRARSKNRLPEVGGGGYAADRLQQPDRDRERTRGRAPFSRPARAEPITLWSGC